MNFKVLETVCCPISIDLCVVDKELKKFNSIEIKYDSVIKFFFVFLSVKSNLPHFTGRKPKVST